MPVVGRDHPRRSRTIHHVWVVEYETPVVVSITFVTRERPQLRRKADLAGTPLEGAADVCKLSIVKQGPAPGTPGAGEGLGPTFLLGR